MKKQIVKESPALQLLKIVWNSDLPDSYRTINEMMSDAMTLACGCLLFEIKDFDTAFKSFRGGYWFGVSTNGKHYGEYFYATAIRYGNASAYQSYEHSFNREPFIINNNRVFVGFTFIYESRYCTVTGWDSTNKVLTVVSYEKGWDEGKRKLLKFTREQWLISRKTIKVC